MIDDNKQRELLEAEMQPKVDEFTKSVDAFLARSRDKIPRPTPKASRTTSWRSRARASPTRSWARRSPSAA